MRQLIVLCAMLSCTFVSALGVVTPMRLRVGQTFPHLELMDLQTQKKFTGQDLVGKVAIVDFWASWCEPCKASFPFYGKLFEERKGKGLVVIGVNVDDQIDEAKTFARANPVPFPLLYDEGRKLTKEIGVSTMPSSYILDRKGHVMEIQKGFVNRKKDEISREVDRLLSQK